MPGTRRSKNAKNDMGESRQKFGDGSTNSEFSFSFAIEKLYLQAVEILLSGGRVKEEEL